MDLVAAHVTRSPRARVPRSRRLSCLPEKAIKDPFVHFSHMILTMWSTIVLSPRSRVTTRLIVSRVYFFSIIIIIIIIMSSSNLIHRLPKWEMIAGCVDLDTNEVMIDFFFGIRTMRARATQASVFTRYEHVYRPES